jgi:hypothetical protein
MQCHIRGLKSVDAREVRTSRNAWPFVLKIIFYYSKICQDQLLAKRGHFFGLQVLMLAKSEHTSAWPNVLNIKFYYSRNWPRASCWPSADKFFRITSFDAREGRTSRNAQRKTNRTNAPRPL